MQVVKDLRSRYHIVGIVWYNEIEKGILSIPYMLLMKQYQENKFECIFILIYKISKYTPEVDVYKWQEKMFTE